MAEGDDSSMSSDGAVAARKDVSAYIDPSAIVGWGTTIGPGAYIGPGVTIGADCIIQPGAVIGEDGFGYQRDPDGHWTPKPHPYGVIIKDGVHVGANTCIDRGSWRDTWIGSGTRIDNGVHVAHNCMIGHDCVIVAHAMLGGSVMVEPGAWIGPSASIMQRVTIGVRALVGMGAVVLVDVPPSQTWAGNPARCLNADVGVREAM